MLEVINQRGMLTENEARLLASKILEAVAYLHDHGVIHRDLKVYFQLFLNVIFDTNNIFSTFVIMQARKLANR